MLTADADALGRPESSTATAPGLATLPCPLQAQWRQLQGRYSSLHGVVLDEQGETVHLKGRVPSHYLKQIALAMACQIAGPRHVVNEIKVEPSRGPERSLVGERASAVD